MEKGFEERKHKERMKSQKKERKKERIVLVDRMLNLGPYQW